mmetsp:Transcript_13850/g.27377  ORF Transcript_13850/g.27377 Transcript_13850/m.27377 type:complete len:105 (+) Transcript_13850:2-316(+)
MRASLASSGVEMSRRDDGASDDPLTQMVIAPSIKFFRDSQMLVRRCAKPDKKGECSLASRASSKSFDCGVHMVTDALERECRIQEDHTRDSDWIPDHGIHWILR